jgi:hypothetical protein
MSDMDNKNQSRNFIGWFVEESTQDISKFLKKFLNFLKICGSLIASLLIIFMIYVNFLGKPIY